jgi:Undecaprenyl-phosphate glucose phosphotransferase
MLKEHARFFKSLFFISDLVLLSLAWVLSYVLRFHTDLIRSPLLGIPPFGHYLEFLLPLWMIWGFVSIRLRLYRPRRVEQFPREVLDIVKGLTLTLFLLIGMIYLFRRFEFSRLAFFYFWVFGSIGVISSRFIARESLKILRSKGYNLRSALVAGTGELGGKVLEKIECLPELGIHVIGFLSGRAEEVGKEIKRVPVIGLYEDLDRILEERRPDLFFIALPISEYGRLESLIRKLEGLLPDVKVVPGACEFLILRGGVDELDGLPIVSLQSSPLYGWNRVYKRIFDLILGGLIFAFSFPIMFVISLLIKLSSEGPLFYRQERLGMEGRPFRILKFRTMRNDAEKETGPAWAKENDPRRTKVGRLLRRTSLDELPQLLNVIKGEMSLVGPRPERPVFVEKFRNGIPSYMLRHKIKAGITGWAQIHGWRGDTSIEKRIEHDLYYIQNWSIGLDLKILFMTLWKGFFSRSAY